ARQRRHRRRVAEDVFQYRAALRPFVEHVLSSTPAETWGMGRRVAANHVTARIQIADLAGGQKSRLPDEVGRDDRVASPPSFLELCCENSVVRHSSIVNGDEEVKSVPAMEI